MSTALVSGSIDAIAKERGTSLADALMDVEHIFLVDTSGSMSAKDIGSDGIRRYDRACIELEKLQNAHPGRCLVYSCSDETKMETNGVPEYQAGGTPIDQWLATVQEFDGMGITFHVISDGVPDDDDAALMVARRMHSTINTYYIGPQKSTALDAYTRAIEEESIKEAITFLKSLATAGRGTHISTEVKLLSEQASVLMLPAPNA